MLDQTSDWSRLASRRLKAIVREAQKSPTLRKLGGASNWRIEVQFVTAPTMAKINSKYRKINEPTDILSFSSPETFRKIGGELGELVICLSVLTRQAAQYGHTAALELEILLVHGLLHLLGMDHEGTKAQALKMARWEKKLLKRSGLIARGQ